MLVSITDILFLRKTTQLTNTNANLANLHSGTILDDQSRSTGDDLLPLYVYNL